MIQRMTPEQYAEWLKEQEELEDKLINGEPVPPEPKPQIQYVPIAGVNQNTGDKSLLWGVLGIVSIVGLIIVGVVALCKK